MPKQPSLFFGHGNPMNATENNRYTQAWREMGQSINQVRAMVFFSAHWAESQTAAATAKHPETLHDFYGFPDRLFRLNYPANSAVEVLEEVKQYLEPFEPINGSSSRGFDHGVWSVLLHFAPLADIPILQLSINESLSWQQQFEIGKALRPLRENGVIIAGSGNIIHNLALYQWNDKEHIYPWAKEFETKVRTALLNKSIKELADLERHEFYKLAHPTREHFSPLFYVLGAADANDSVNFPVEGFDGGSISMLSVDFS